MHTPVTMWYASTKQEQLVVTVCDDNTSLKGFYYIVKLDGQEVTKASAMIAFHSTSHIFNCALLSHVFTADIGSKTCTKSCITKHIEYLQ